MKKIGFFWGSTSDNTKDAAEFMQEYLEGEGYEVDSKDIGEVDVEDLQNYDKLLIGCPTWNIGELQDDWDSVFLKFKELDFKGKTAAFFGCGDQTGYPDNFLDAIGILAKPFMDNGGTLIGRASREPYEFRESVALDGDELLGLGLDYDNFDEDENDELMIPWLDQIIKEFG
ncbi:MAG: flavodoxin [Candidatus Marinimicrobia bacterium]|nr:flavodoxin [Candidatus Neomarinimicrobiota bacterium]